MPSPSISELQLTTTWGVIRLAASAGRLTSCELPTLRATPKRALRVQGERMRTSSAADHRVLHAGAAFVRSALAGRQTKRPPLGWATSAPFLTAAWRAMMRIPPGATRTYQQLAAMAGSPRAMRAAGQACARNPLPLFVPCHRILASGGRLGGFSSGLPWKVELLQREGVGAARRRTR